MIWCSSDTPRDDASIMQAARNLMSSDCVLCMRFWRASLNVALDMICLLTGMSSSMSGLGIVSMTFIMDRSGDSLACMLAFMEKRNPDIWLRIFSS